MKPIFQTMLLGMSVSLVPATVCPQVLGQQAGESPSSAQPSDSLQFDDLFVANYQDNWKDELKDLRAIRIDTTEANVKVFADDQLFTVFQKNYGNKPILWPLIGPAQKPMTRGWPQIDESKTADSSWSTSPEEKDHIHHRSFWFTHGEVNDYDFWTENDPRSKIVQTEIQEVENLPWDASKSGVKTVNHWLGSNDLILVDERVFGFYASERARWIDVQIDLIAQNEPVNFGDTKEGSFGVRVAGPMKVDAGLGGRIVNRDLFADSDAWGKSSSWTDYSGPLTDAPTQETQGDDEPIGNPTERGGITIFVHPTSWGGLGRWHVRTYGLFAHNPFGVKDFVGEDSGQQGGFVLEANTSIRFFYRVLLHQGSFEVSYLEGCFQNFASLSSPR